jgi:UDPglucose--hexose-1-phosphate uridylyltransferase
MEQMTAPEVLAYRDNGSQPNGPGWRVRAVSKKFPALRIEGAAGRRGDGLYDLMNGIGAHEVLVESPDHDRGLADLELHQIEELLWAYRERVLDLARDDRFRYVLIFKNHGAEAGASLEHPHSQLIALPILPLNVQQELRGASAYYPERLPSRLRHANLAVSRGEGLTNKADQRATGCVPGNERCVCLPGKGAGRT